MVDDDVNNDKIKKFNLNKKNFYVKKLGAARLNKVNKKTINVTIKEQ